MTQPGTLQSAASVLLPDLQNFRIRHPEVTARLDSTRYGIPGLTAVFSCSRFLTEAVVREPGIFEVLVANDDLHRGRTVEELKAELASTLDVVPAPLPFARFRRRQLLRILLRDALGLTTLAEITDEISAVADAILDTAWRQVRQALAERFGEPMCGTDRCGFSAIALGKLGGRELNYSSDIDLMFVYSGNGSTSGPSRISNKEFFVKAVNQLTELMSAYTPEGQCYRVDLRLRPDGRHGEVCLSLEGAKAYYQSRARDWELQMLIKARVAAGEAGPGGELLASVEPRIYSTTLDFSAVEAVSATRERIGEKLASRRQAAAAGIDIKLTRGGIRDIEFLVQCLQRLHGGREPWVRQAGTLLALRRLHDKALISSSEYSRLACAYEFLRHLEHRLQIDEDRQTHTLPHEPEQLDRLARRMPAAELGRLPTGAKLVHQLNIHLEEVQSTYDRVIHAQQPLYYSAATPSSGTESPETPAHAPVTNLLRFLDAEAPGIAAVVQASGLHRGQSAFEAFLENVLARPALLQQMDASAQLTRDAVELFELSPYFAEELIRRPEGIEQVAQARSREAPDYGHLTAKAGGASELRGLFRREMLRIQAESICGAAPIFDTLGRTSDLADAIVRAAYDFALQDVLAAHPPVQRGYQPRDEMIVIALGRLGMREFDLGSDADLNFVLPDEDAAETRFWTRVAERMVSLISAYTGEGVMFTVDTRLRPEGRSGALVQTAGVCRDYLANRAEAWEGIAWMKSRAIAGNAARGTAFLHEVQEVDWRRYGQSGRSRDELRDMRARLERESGESHPLKAGSGGYYDIDFALMYLRLRSAGIFFRVLNTPERIDIVETTGHIDREDAAFLSTAATLYRAIDHGLRVYSGQAEGRLPQSPVHLAALTALVKRWVPEQLEVGTLPETLSDIRIRTRRFFRKLFGE
ncbi:MAG TPA: glutamine-synthetase adenylyltransferase [Bryobacteraceae bacterium]|nr:glutamine-synthetase adenylyltransferase [Bryobacteraceae bacterium]